MHVDVIVLAGGRSSRLDGVAKASLVVDGTTLLQRAVEAGLTAIAVGADAAPGAGAARGEGGRLVVVGPDDDSTALGDIHHGALGSSGAVLRTRETPPFGGPAAGIAAGLAALAPGPAPAAGTLLDRAFATPPGTAAAPLVAVIACDHPRVDRALPVVLAAALRDSAGEFIDAWVACGSDERSQPLLAVYRRAALDGRVAAVRRERPQGVDGASVRTLIEGLTLTSVPVPIDDTADIDTWADAARFGATPPTASVVARFGATPPTAPVAAGFGGTPPTASVAAGDHPTHSGGSR